jgi:RES domain-containing protein
MLVYRITLTNFAGSLTASGRAARWNLNDVDMIYTASSRSLACLENVVHRSQAGLNLPFSVITINIPDNIALKTIAKNSLPANWAAFEQVAKTQALGNNWLKANESAVLAVPSSIIDEEVNYLLNPAHADLKKIRIVKIQPFVFDSRIKNAG